MDNLKKFKFAKLDSSEMKQVQGGRLLTSLIKPVDNLVSEELKVLQVRELLKDVYKVL